MEEPQQRRIEPQGHVPRKEVTKEAILRSPMVCEPYISSVTIVGKELG